MLTLLEDAIHNYRKYRSARDRVGKERFQDAEAWIMESETEWIFSFENVCELLGLDPAYLRRGLLQTQPQTRQAAKKGESDDLPR